MFARRRHLAILAVLAAVPVLIATAVYFFDGPDSGDGPPFLDRVTDNGLFVGITALVICIPLFLPLAVGVVAGDTVAGEAGQGTLRYLLLSPAGRTRLLVVKLVGVVVFCTAATLTVVTVGAAVGWRSSARRTSPCCPAAPSPRRSPRGARCSPPGTSRCRWWGWVRSGCSCPR
jgi:ABC-2 type transport system permease protein